MNRNNEGLSLILIATFLFISHSINAQGKINVNHFEHFVCKEMGDLNEDGLEDLAIVYQDTLNQRKPYRLEIFFKRKNGSFKKQISTKTAIEPKIPRIKQGGGFYKIEIVNNVLEISNELLRGNYKHKFRYQNGDFYLIGFSQTYSNGLGIISELEFNLSTGSLIEKEENYETNKVVRYKKQILKIRPLPKLRNFIPNETEYY